MHMFSIVTFLSRFLLLILLTTSVGGQFSSAHEMQTSVSPTKTGESFALASAKHSDQKTSQRRHEHSGDCHICSNCINHVFLPVQTIKLDYNAVITSFCSFKPIVNLPEVTLSRFIPPRNVS